MTSRAPVELIVLGITGMSRAGLVEKLAARSIETLRVPALGPCREWTGARSRGYGTTWVPAASSELACHRLSWLLFFGPIPAGHGVLHRCDNPPCWRPDHLFTGTQIENARDMAAKARGVLNGNRFQRPQGEHHVEAKLTEEAVKEMRRLGDAGMPGTKLAIQFGISERHAYRIIRRERWRHVAD